MPTWWQLAASAHQLPALARLRLEKKTQLLRRRDLHAHVHGVEVNVGELAVAGAHLRLGDHGRSRNPT